MSKNKAQYSCVFIDPLGGLKEICVPFHFALNSKNGKRARDIHLLRKLRTFLREEDFNEAKLVSEVANTCLSLETNEVRIQTMEVLMNSKHILPDALLAATDSFVVKRGMQTRSMKCPIATYNVLQYSVQLIQMFILIIRLFY